MAWIIENWQIVLLVIMIIDKIVAMTPPTTWIGKHDDLIWTAIKKVFIDFFKTKKRGP